MWTSIAEEPTHDIMRESPLLPGVAKLRRNANSNMFPTCASRDAGDDVNSSRLHLAANADYHSSSSENDCNTAGCSGQNIAESALSPTSDQETATAAVTSALRVELRSLREWISEQDEKLWLRFEHALLNMKVNLGCNEHLGVPLTQCAQAEALPAAPDICDVDTVLECADGLQKNWPFVDDSSQRDLCQYTGTRDLLSQDTRAVHSQRLAQWQEDMEKIMTRQRSERSVLSMKLKNCLNLQGCLTFEGPPRNRIARVVQSNTFTMLVAMVIVLNAIFVGVEVNNKMKAWTEHKTGFEERKALYQGGVMRKIDRGFMTFFLVELVLRIVGLRTWFFFGDEKVWNLFDIALVATSLRDLFIGGRNANSNFLRILKMFRAVRVLRVIRLLKFFRELRRMVMSILAAVQSLSWALLLLLLVIYVFAVMLMRAGIEFMDDTTAAADRKLWEDYYGSVSTTMYMLIQAVSGGKDWGELAEPLGKVSEFYKVLYVMFILFVSFGLVNVLAGVFIGSATDILDCDFISQNEIVQEQKFVKELTGIFRQCDVDHDGEMAWDDFRGLLLRPQVKAFLAAHQLDIRDGAHLFSLCTGDMKASSILVSEFVIGCARLKGPANSLQIQSMMMELRALDRFIRTDFDSLKHLVRSLRGNAHPAGVYATLSYSGRRTS